MSRKPRLHIPMVPARPGADPDFSYVEVVPAGEVPRPDPSTRLRDMPDSLIYDLVRVLDDEHAPVGPWDPQIDQEVLQAGLRYMLETRLYDDHMQRMQRQGKISLYMKSRGEEAVSVAAAMALRPGDKHPGALRALAETAER